jgi:ScpA/B protein.
MEDYVRRTPEEPWERLVDLFTADMEPGGIDIEVLAERYTEYIDALEDTELEVPARSVRVCSHLLKLKTFAVAGDPLHVDQEDGKVEQPENGEEDGPDLSIPESSLEMPVEPEQSRRVTLSELKSSLRDALDVKHRREQRLEETEEVGENMRIDETSLEDKIDSLLSRLGNLVSTTDEQKVEFETLVEEGEPEEKLEKFLHVLQLEDDEKVRCIQEEFLGDLEVEPQETLGS